MAINKPFNKAPMHKQKSENAPPVKIFRAGGVKATIWENTNKELQVYKTISFERNYKDKDGEWKQTNSLRVQDLMKASLVLQKAYEYCVMKAENETATETTEIVDD